MPPAPVPRGALLAAAALAGCGGGQTVTDTVRDSRPGVSLGVSPSTGRTHDRFTVAITTRRRAGVVGDTRSAYVVEAHAARPASDCVNNSDRVFPDGPGGRRARAKLDPARGEGGPLGWCRGRFLGTVTYFEGFACPPTGTCRPPPGVPKRRHVVARFSFRVR
jgi:hypothetical protein